MDMLKPKQSSYPLHEIGLFFRARRLFERRILRVFLKIYRKTEGLKLIFIFLQIYDEYTWMLPWAEGSEDTPSQVIIKRMKAAGKTARVRRGKRPPRRRWIFTR